MKTLKIYDWTTADKFHGYKRGQKLDWEKRHEVIDDLVEKGLNVMLRKIKGEEYAIFVDTQRFQQR